MGFDLARKQNILDQMLTAAASTSVATAPIKCRLITTQGTDAANGTEVTGGSYVAGGQACAFGASTVLATVGARSTNTGAPSYTGMPATTVNAAEFWDSAGTPKRMAQGALTAAKTTLAGDTLTVPAGSATIDLP